LAYDSEHGKLWQDIKADLDKLKARASSFAADAEWAFGRRTARVLGIIMLFAVVVALLLVFLNWYVAPTEPTEKKDLVLALAQILAGTALLSGLYFTWRTLQVNREGQITERFTRAIDQLGKTDEGNKLIDQALAIVGKALVPRRPTERQAVWGIRITVALALLILSIVLVSRSGFLSSENAAVIGALLALTGVLIAQVVNTNIARATQRHQQGLEDQRAREQQRLEDRRARAATLQSYLEQMGKLLTDDLPPSLKLNNETNSDQPDDAPVIVRSQTLAVLEGLHPDPTRKRIVVQFLYESGLIDKEKPTVSLSRANLSGTDLGGMDLSGADLSYADLSEADLRETNLRGTALRHSNLRGIHVSGERIGPTSLGEIEGEMATSGIWLRGRRKPPKTDLRGADLSYADLRQTNLSTAALSRANLTGTDLHEADLSEANLRGAILWQASLREANLTETDLSGANLLIADLRGADFHEANLSGADLTRATLKDSNLIGTNLGEADLTEADLRGVDYWMATNFTQEQIRRTWRTKDGRELHPGAE
jgi:uncharacterized protein YjbI with pentapeptide repeats